MMSALPFVVVLVVLITLAVFFWIWWVGPQGQVPPHLTEIELRRLEVQDRLRQTNYQILTALGLGATFLATVVQLTITSRQWSEDYKLKTTQDRLGRYAEALKSLDNDKATSANISGISSLLNLALQDPDGYHAQVNEVLSTLVRQRATEDRVQMSGECRDYDGSKGAVDQKLNYPRGEALPEVQAAMTALGHPRFATYRQQFASGVCEPSTGRLDLTGLRLDHLYLDELDLSARDFTCANLSQSHFRRGRFRNAILRGADFGGARIADFEVPGFPADDPLIRQMFEPDEKGGLGWMLYRCRVADFHGADLTRANFQGAVLGGADFRKANLTDASFCAADISRANFAGAFTRQKDQLKALLADACVGESRDVTPDSPDYIDEKAQPFGLDKLGIPKIPRCSPKKTCSSSESE